MSDPLGELKLFFIDLSIDDNDYSGFVTARTAEEAFALWRCDREFERKVGDSDDWSVEVAVVPPLGRKPGVETWHTEEIQHFQLSDNTLAMQAVAASYHHKFTVWHHGVAPPTTTVVNPREKTYVMDVSGPGPVGADDASDGVH